MKSLLTTAAALCLLIAVPTLHAGGDRGARPDDDALEADAASRKCLEFGALSLVVQANMMDGDTEIFVTAIGQGSARLSHLMALAPILLTPGEHQILARERFLVRWSAVPQAVSYGVELKNVATGRKLVAELPAGTLNFLVPPAWLQTASEAGG